MSALFLILMAIEWYNLFLINPETEWQLKVKYFIEISLYLKSNTPNSCFKGATGSFLSDCICWQMKVLFCISLIRIENQPSNVSHNQWRIVGKGVSIPGQKSSYVFKPGFFQWKTMSSISNTWYPFLSISCALKLESTVSLNSRFPCHFGFIRKRAERLTKKSYPRDNYKFQVASRKFGELIVI